MVDGEAITEVEDCYACQAWQVVKTAKMVDGDGRCYNYCSSQVVKIEDKLWEVPQTNFLPTGSALFFHFQELGTLLDSLKEGVKTVTAITKYVMVIGEEYALGD